MSTNALRFDRLAPVLVSLVAFAAAVHAVDALPVGVFYDDALYAILGKALAAGEGYRYLNVPGAPAGTHYPPGYPLLLALLWRIAPHFPENVALFKGVNALLVGAVAYLTFRFARARLEMPTWMAAVTALAGTAAIPLLVLSSAVMSEVFFLTLLLPWLMIAERATSRVADSGGARRTVAIAASGALLFYVRVHAIVLLPGLALVYLAARRRRDALVALVVGAVVVLPWFAWVAAHDAAIPLPLRGSYGSYGAWLVQGVRDRGAGILFAAFTDNARTTVAIVARSFAIAQSPVPSAFAVAAVLALCVAGMLALAERSRVTLIFLALYLATLLVWPFSPLRFIWGVWPLIVLLLAAGAMRWTSRAAPKGLRMVGVSATAIAATGMLVFNFHGYANAWWTTVSRTMTPRIQPQLEWVASHTRDSDVVAADDEGAVYLYTGRRAVPATAFTAEQYFRRRASQEDAANLALILREFSPSYVVAWTDPTVAAAEVLATRPPRVLLRVDTIQGGRVYGSRR